MSSDSLTKEEEIIQAAVRVIASAAFNVIYADPHQWSTRGCDSCRTVTSLIGVPFGCERFRREHQR